MISYQLTKKEIVQRLWARSMRRRRVVLAIVWLGSIGAAMLILIPNAGRAAGVVPLALALMAPYNVRRMLSRSVDADATFTEPVDLDFDEAKVRTTRPTSKAEWAWSRFKGFSEDDKYFYLETARDGYGSTGMVPKRAFASDEQMESFRRIASGAIGGR